MGSTGVDCCNGSMSNTNNGPRQPQGPGDQPYGQHYTDGAGTPPYAPQSAHCTENKFFQWIRESRVVRTNDRVVAGVCGGIARELGWNVALVRVLMVVTALFGGFGVILYALGWALLPDEMTGAIAFEELMNGRWDWSYIGIVLCILIGIFPGFLFGGASALAALLAILVMYVLISNGRRRFPAMYANGPAPQSPQGPYGFAPNTGAPRAPYTNPYANGQPSHGSQPRPDTPQGTTGPQGSAGPQRPTGPQSYRSHHASTSGPNRPPVAPQPPRTAAAPRTVRMRRPGAGAPLVLLVLGLTILTGAILFTDHYLGDTVAQAIRPTILYTGIVTTVLGVLVIILGICGHRTGGLHPFVWIAMFMSLTLVAVGTSYSAVTAMGGQLAKNYTKIELNGPATIESTQSDMNELANGIYVQGSNYDRDILTIDLTDYAKHHAKHEVQLNDGTTGTSQCPTGPINLMASNARIKIVLPLGCSWGVANGDGVLIENDYANTIGGRGSLYTRFNPFTGSVMPSIDVNVNVTSHNDSSTPAVPSTPATPSQSSQSVSGHRVTTVDDHSDDDMNDTDVDTADDNDSYDFATGLWFDDPAIPEFCNGITTNDGKITIGKETQQSAKQLIADGKYWPCAVDADKAVKTPELVVVPNLLLGAQVNIGYTNLGIHK